MPAPFPQSDFSHGGRHRGPPLSRPAGCDSGNPGHSGIARTTTHPAGAAAAPSRATPSSFRSPSALEAGSSTPGTLSVSAVSVETGRPPADGTLVSLNTNLGSFGTGAGGAVTSATLALAVRRRHHQLLPGRRGRQRHRAGPDRRDHHPAFGLLHRARRPLSHQRVAFRRLGRRRRRRHPFRRRLRRAADRRVRRGAGPGPERRQRTHPGRDPAGHGGGRRRRHSGGRRHRQHRARHREAQNRDAQGRLHLRRRRGGRDLRHRRRPEFRRRLGRRAGEGSRRRLRGAAPGQLRRQGRP